MLNLRSKQVVMPAALILLIIIVLIVVLDLTSNKPPAPASKVASHFVSLSSTNFSELPQAINQEVTVQGKIVKMSSGYGVAGTDKASEVMQLDLSKTNIDPAKYQLGKVTITGKVIKVSISPNVSTLQLQVSSIK